MKVINIKSLEANMTSPPLISYSLQTNVVYVIQLKMYLEVELSYVHLLMKLYVQLFW